MPVRYYTSALLALAIGTSTLPQSEPTLTITSVAVVDVISGTTRINRTVVIKGNRITAIEPTAGTRVATGAGVLNGSGMFLIPGLWDMHTHVAHFGPTSLELYLAQGVTSVRDMGAERFAEAKSWRDRIAKGQLTGPRMRIASPVVENPDWLAFAKRAAEGSGTPWTLHERFGPTSAEDAERWVDSVGGMGADHIKVRNWPSPEIGRALVERARQRKIQVAGHGNEPFPRTGVVTLEHYIWPPLTISDTARSALWRQLAANGVALVPTLVTWPTRLDAPDALVARLDATQVRGLRYVPDATRTRWRHQLLQLKQERPMDWTGIHRDEMRNVAEMQKAGMTLLAGTDTGAPLVVPGFSLHEELALLIATAGMTPDQALRAATVSPARVVGLADSLGSIDVGKLADLVLLDGDPLMDIRNTARIHAVIANGRLLDRSALDRMLANAERAAGSVTP
jgi:hypothetical protein